jgi:magnesium transporter
MEWHSILNPEGPELDRLAERYRLHPLHIEDCRHRNQSAKIEDGEGYLFTVVKAIRLDGSGRVEDADLDIFLGPDYLITVIEDDWPGMRDIVDHARGATAEGEQPGRAYYRLLDQLVDSYLPVLDHYDDVIDAIQDKALESPSPEVLSTIFDAKRSLVLLRRILANTRDVAGRLLRSDSTLLPREMWPFFRDLYDHVARGLDTVEVMRDILGGSLDVYLSSVANRTNQVMKVLTVLGTVALPALIVSGIYGMNVKGLPGAESPFGLLIVLLLMAAGTVGLLALLKRFKWF